MDKIAVVNKLNQFLEEEKELQTEYALAVAEAYKVDPQEYFNLVQDYSHAKGRVSAIKDVIELVESVVESGVKLEIVR